MPMSYENYMKKHPNSKMTKAQWAKKSQGGAKGGKAPAKGKSKFMDMSKSPTVKGLKKVTEKAKSFGKDQIKKSPTVKGLGKAKKKVEQAGKKVKDFGKGQLKKSPTVKGLKKLKDKAKGMLKKVTKKASVNDTHADLERKAAYNQNKERLIRIAYENPEARPYLLPIILNDYEA